MLEFITKCIAYQGCEYKDNDRITVMKLAISRDLVNCWFMTEESKIYLRIITDSAPYYYTLYFHSKFRSDVTSSAHYFQKSNEYKIVLKFPNIIDNKNLNISIQCAVKCTYTMNVEKALYASFSQMLKSGKTVLKCILHASFLLILKSQTWNHVNNTTEPSV